MDGYEFENKSCDEKDTTFKFIQEKAGTKGVFYLAITTEKETYLKLEKCTLELYLNNELIKNLKPEMEASPDAVVRTTIIERYYKDGKTSDVLID